MLSEIPLANRFHGLNRSVAPQELAETESPDTTDAANYLDRVGALGPRLGRARSILKTYPLLGMGLCITPWGRYRLFADNQGVWHADKVTWPGSAPADPATADATGNSTTARAHFLQYKYRTYCFNGRDRMKAFDGIDWQLAGIESGITWSAQFKPSVSLGSTGISGSYYYYVVAANSKRLDTAGRPIEGIPSLVSDVASPANNTVTIGGIPSTHVDPQVDSWNIYRTLNGGYDAGLVPDQQDFFYLATIPLATTSFADNKTDDAAGLSFAYRLRFDQNIAPTFKAGAIYGDRMFGAGFDPINAGTATKNSGDNSLIDFSGVTIPSGAKGCWLQAAGSAVKYRIIRVVSSTQVKLDRVFAGALSAAAYTIFRYPWEIYFSEFMDLDAWGPDGDSNRFMLALPRGQEIVGMIPYNDRLFIFTKDSIFEIYGKGPNRPDVKINPEPAFFGLGAVSQDSIVRVDNEVHFLSLRGPAVITGSGEPKLNGIPLLTDWLDSLTAAEHPLCCVGTDNTRVWYSVPVHGQTMASKTFRYERLTDAWWEETEICPLMYVRQDGDSGAVDQLFYLQDRFVCTPRNVGQANDLVTPISGMCSSATTTTATLVATLPTTNGGLEQCWVRIYEIVAGQVDPALRNVRRIISNDAHTITWSSDATLPGAGAIVPITQPVLIEIGNIGWKWLTRSVDFIDPLRKVRTHLKKDPELYVTFNAKSDTATLIINSVIDAIEKNDLHTVTLKEYTKKQDTGRAAMEYAYRLQSRNGAVIKHAALKGQIESETV